MAIFYIHKSVGAICYHVVCHTKCYAQLLDYVVLLKYDNVIHTILGFWFGFNGEHTRFCRATVSCSKCLHWAWRCELWMTDVGDLQWKNQICSVFLYTIITQQCARRLVSVFTLTCLWLFSLPEGLKIFVIDSYACSIEMLVYNKPSTAVRF